MGKSLLLADDSVTMQKVVGITFANEDIDLATVDNGDAALERARQIRPDVVLADVGMPGLNGYELCAALKADPDLDHVRVILLTGTFDTYDEARAAQVGADAHVSKPFEAQALVDQVHALLAAPGRQGSMSGGALGLDLEQAEPSTMRQVVAEPPMLEPPELDLDALELDSNGGTTAPDAVPDLDTSLDDYPAPTGMPASPLDQDLSQTTFLDPRETAPDLMADPLDLGGAEDGSAEADMRTVLVPPGESEDLFGPGGEPFGSEQDFDSSGIFGAPPETDTGLEAQAHPEPPLETPDLELPEADLADDDPLSSPELPLPSFDLPEEPPTQARDAFAAAPPETVLDPLEDEGELELGESEELLFADPLDGEEPETPSLRSVDVEDVLPPRVPSAPPARRPEPAEPERAAPPAAPARSGAAASPAVAPPTAAPTRAVAERPAPEAPPLDPAELRQALEKVAWEAFGPLSEQIVREVVKKVEAIAWETLPQIAERLVREEIARLRGPDED